ncbi:MAG: DUF2189 domain-containing protein [Alphaproteobacteria bacterium]
MTEQDIRAVHTPPRLKVKTATWDDLKQAAGAGLRDVKARPGLSFFFGLVYALIGGALISGFIILDQFWIVIAAGMGFPLVAPFLAAGLYEISRRREQGEAFTAKDIMLVVFNQRRREFSWMAFVMLFVFWIWAYQARLLLAIFLQNHSILSLDNLFRAVFTTNDGLAFLATGSVVGAAIATILFSITVVSMPLLLEREVDFITAMITSVKAVTQSPVVMLTWGALVGALTLVSVAPAMIGVVFVFPVLGHISWHLYRRLVSEADGASSAL